LYTAASYKLIGNLILRLPLGLAGGSAGGWGGLAFFLSCCSFLHFSDAVSFQCHYLVYFCKGSKASANALPIRAKISALPK